MGLLLSPSLLGPAQGLMSAAPAAVAAPVVAQAAAPASGGLLAMFAPKAAQSPLYQAFDQRRNVLTNMLLSGVGAESPLERMRGMAQGIAAGRQQDSAYKTELDNQRKQQDQINKTMELLTKQRPDLVPWVENGSITPAEAFKILYSGNGDAGVYGTPIYGTDANGKQVLGVIGKDGTFKQLDTGGVTPTPGVQWQDFGTYRQGFGKGGQPLTPQITKDNYGEAFDTGRGGAEGKARGEANVSLPGDLLTAEQTVNEIDQLINHPGLDSIVGPLDQYRGDVVLGPEGRDAKARLEQLKGRAFLQAYALLKGGGAITEVEGVKAEQAMARLNRAQDEKTFRAALKDLRDAVGAGVEKLRQRAGQPAIPPTAPAANRATSGVQWTIEGE